MSHHKYHQHKDEANCKFCQLPQQLAHADILYDNSKCELLTCTKCLKEHEDQNCTVCGKKYKDHANKLKNHFIKEYLEQGKADYEKQKRMRSDWKDVKHVDQELIALLAYFNRYDKNKYADFKRDIMRIQDKINNEKYIIYEDTQKKKFPQLKMPPQNLGDGKKGCGVLKDYDKGIKYIIEAFSKTKL